MASEKAREALSDYVKDIQEGLESLSDMTVADWTIQRIVAAERGEGETQAINIIFDGPPSHESGRFVEVETDDGRSINAGEWKQRPDGLWALRITALPTKRGEPSGSGQPSAEDHLMELIDKHLSKFPPEEREAMVDRAIQAARTKLKEDAYTPLYAGDRFVEGLRRAQEIVIEARIPLQFRVKVNVDIDSEIEKAEKEVGRGR